MGQDNVVISGVHSTPLALQLQSASIALLCHHLCMKCCVFAFGYACQENFAAGGGAAEKEEEKKDEPEEESDEVCVVYLHQHQYSWQALMTLVARFFPKEPYYQFLIMCGTLLHLTRLCLMRAC